MALIKCKLCGKQITDTVKKCPHCGFMNDKYRNIRLEALNQKKWFIIASILIAACIVTFFVVAGIKIIDYTNEMNLQANTLTENEKVGALAVKKLKSSLKENNDINIDEIWYRKTNLSVEQVLINYTVQSSEGNSITIVSLVEDGKLKGNDAKADKTVSKYSTKSEKEEISLAQEIRDLWNTKGSAYQLFAKLDKDKVLRNLEQAK